MLNLNDLREGTCYEDDFRRTEVSFHLTFSAHLMFNTAHMIKHAEHIAQRPELSHEELKGLNLEPELLSGVKIIAGVENYFKAILLYKGYLIHEFNDNEKELKKNQKKTPIEVKDIQNLNKTVIPGKGTYIKGINNSTMGFSKVIGAKKYLDILELDKWTLSFLKSISEKRNSLHFMSMSSSTFSPEINNNYLKLKNNVNKYIIDLNEKIGTYGGYNNKSFIKNNP